MKTKHLLTTSLLAIAALTSCSSGKTVMPYFTDLPNAEGEMPIGDFTVKIMPDDELLVNISADDPQAVDLFTLPYQHPRTRDVNTPNNTLRESSILTARKASLTLQPYMVNKEGFINFPQLGKIHVEGMTLEALAAYLTEKISETVVNPIVTVELINFHVNVMGEVSRPGTQLVNRERYSILDAIATAGDLTAYGERDNVLLIREEDGKRTYHRLNLNKAETLESPYFFLKQNDVVYVEPNSVKQANARVDNARQYRLSMTSVIVSAASVIASLAISLFIK